MIADDMLRTILTDLQTAIGERPFALWFSGMSARSLKNKTLTVSVSTEYFKQSIQKDYADALHAAAQRHGVNTVKIIINAAATPTASPRAPEDDATDAQYAASKAHCASVGMASRNPPEHFGELYINEKTSRKDRTYTFDSFVVGPSNEFAASIAAVIANNPGQAYNPYLVYGPVGLGKTHILKAIGNKIFNDNNKTKILYITSESFLNSYVDAIQGKSMSNFRNRMRRLDVLLVDDVQFFSGKEKTQDELFHIFNVLFGEEKQMVFASDRPVNRIKELEERLASRFQSGTSADLQPPTEEMAIAIIKRELDKLKRKKKPVAVTADLIECIASDMRNNIRDMLGLVQKIVGYKDITGKTVTIDMLQKWITDHKQPTPEGFSSENILKTTASHFTVSLSDMKSKKRTRDISKARHICMYLLRKHNNDLTYTEIGKTLNVSHVVATRAYSDIEKELEVGGQTADNIIAIEQRLKYKHT